MMPAKDEAAGEDLLGTTIPHPADRARPVPRAHGPWTIEATSQPYRDPWVRLCRDEVTRPDGKAGSYAVVYLKPGVCVIAVDAQDRVYLTYEFYYGVGRVTLEAVSGGIEAGEDPLPTAKRELAEELGIEAERWTELGWVDPFTANVVSPTRLYLAEQLSLGRAAPEGTEQIECVRIDFDEAVRRVMASQITHAPSCVAILKVALRRGLSMPAETACAPMPTGGPSS